jgi:hypothetical protein
MRSLQESSLAEDERDQHGREHRDQAERKELNDDEQEEEQPTHY